MNIECTNKEKDAGLNQDIDAIAYDNKDDVNGKNMTFLFIFFFII